MIHSSSILGSFCFFVLNFYHSLGRCTLHYYNLEKSEDIKHTNRIKQQGIYLTSFSKWMEQQTITNISISESHKRREVVENHDRPHAEGTWSFILQSTLQKFWEFFRWDTYLLNNTKLILFEYSALWLQCSCCSISHFLKIPHLS